MDENLEDMNSATIELLKARKAFNSARQEEQAAILRVCNSAALLLDIISEYSANEPARVALSGLFGISAADLINARHLSDEIDGFAHGFKAALGFSDNYLARGFE